MDADLLLDNELPENYSDMAQILLNTYFRKSNGEWSIIYDYINRKLYLSNELVMDQKSRSECSDATLHSWKYCDSDTDVRRKCFEHTISRYEEMRNTIYTKSNSSNDEKFKQEGIVKVNKINRFISKLKTVSFRTCVWAELLEKVSFKPSESLK
ncbi:Hypothetical protein HVR_LOCUS891 [uncultured virus]|nr:Hypothetical protein HVR_LOCUS891 [uncultured virus]